MLIGPQIHPLRIYISGHTADLRQIGHPKKDEHTQKIVKHFDFHVMNRDDSPIRVVTEGHPSLHPVMKDTQANLIYMMISAAKNDSSLVCVNAGATELYIMKELG